MKAPIFLFGTTRSGTTLLSLMLGHHPEIASAGELEWIWDFAPATPPALEPYHTWLATHRHFAHHRLQIDRSLNFDDLLRSFMEQMRATVDPNRARPLAVFQVHRHYARALRLCPEARCIHVVRDGRDVGASWKQFGWLGNGYEAGLRWRTALAEWEDATREIPAARRTEIHFEELIRYPERELTRLCEFAGTRYSAAMLRYPEDSTYGPPDPAQAGKWKKNLARRDLRLFESVGRECLVQRGYELSNEKPYVLRPWSPLLLKIDGKLRHHRAQMRVYGFGLWLADLLTRRLRMHKLHKRVRLALNQVETARLQ